MRMKEFDELREQARDFANSKKRLESRHRERTAYLFAKILHEQSVLRGTVDVDMPDRLGLREPDADLCSDAYAKAGRMVEAATSHKLSYASGLTPLNKELWSVPEILEGVGICAAGPAYWLVVAAHVVHHAQQHADTWVWLDGDLFHCVAPGYMGGIHGAASLSKALRSWVDWMAAELGLCLGMVHIDHEGPSALLSKGHVRKVARVGGPCVVTGAKWVLPYRNLGHAKDPAKCTALHGLKGWGGAA